MPELAEVEQSCRQWKPGIGQRVADVHVARPDSRIFRGGEAAALRRALLDCTLLRSQCRGKQMLFEFSGSAFLGVHLGMRGELRCEHEAVGAPFTPRKHDYLALRMSNGAVLVLEDKRLFGRVRFHAGPELPEWWTVIAPAVTSAEFTREVMAQFLARRRRTVIKAALLMQERFPGVGNWMADEILWRARIHPATPCGTLQDEEIARVFRAVR